jgi:RNA polymerase sigma factor (TIGR02999 family)
MQAPGTFLHGRKKRAGLARGHVEAGLSELANPDITRLLRELSQGRSNSLDRLMPLVYDQLRRISHRQLRGERRGHTLSTTALVHEAYLKLVDIEAVDWRDRGHFFAMAGRLMRRVLVDHARTRKRRKRGGDWVRVPLDGALDVSIERADTLLALDEALDRLEARNERQSRVVHYRFFVGLSVEETAAALGISEATVKRDWAYSRAWLNRSLALTNGSIEP